jgi:hypothetical protein
MASTARKMKIARPAARKSSGKSKPKSGSARKSEVQTQTLLPAVEAANPRRRLVEPPKIAGELPTPLATFYF